MQSVSRAAITLELEQLGSPVHAGVLQRFFKTAPGQYGEGDRFRGIRVPVLRGLVRKFAALPTAEAVALLHSGYHEDRLLGLFFLVRRFGQGDDGQRRRIFRLYLDNVRFVNSWDLVDASAPHIAGAYLFEKDTAPLYRLAGSGVLWERRIAIVATHHFIKRDRFADTLKLAGLLLGDAEDLIHKAVGWMLREVGKRNLRAEERFLQAHCARMPRTMLRYAIERFPEKKRRFYLNGGCHP